jgi:hypothetical protein
VASCPFDANEARAIWSKEMGIEEMGIEELDAARTEMESVATVACEILDAAGLRVFDRRVEEYDEAIATLPAKTIAELRIKLKDAMNHFGAGPFCVSELNATQASAYLLLHSMHAGAIYPNYLEKLGAIAARHVRLAPDYIASKLLVTICEFYAQHELLVA